MYWLLFLYVIPMLVILFNVFGCLWSRHWADKLYQYDFTHLNFVVGVMFSVTPFINFLLVLAVILLWLAQRLDKPVHK